MSAITLFGAGSWGTALSVHLASAGRDITLWARRQETVDAIRGTSRNPQYLSSIPIPTSVHVTADLQEAASASQVWGMTMPSQKLRPRAQSLEPYADETTRVVSLSKGIENETLRRMTQVLDETLRAVPTEQIGVLSGPSHAEEVAEGCPTTLVAAAPTEPEARRIQKAFMTERMRIYLSTDVTGVEIGGSTKNVLAIAAGVGDGVGYGDNAKAALVTRGIAEMRRLGQAIGADPKTFSGLSGIGDLVVTCMSQHSRNRRLGERIGRGEPLEDILHEMDMVAEGVRTTQSIYGLAQHHGIEMPITEAVYSVLFQGREPAEMVKRLMTRSAKREHWLPEASGSPELMSPSTD